MSKDKNMKCCFCCHVKVGTFALSVLFLIAGVLGIIGASLCLSNAVKPQEIETEEFIQTNGQYNRTTLWVALGNGVFIAVIAILAIYGILKSRAGFLLPIFILQLFNFICTVIYLGNVMFYWHDIKTTIIEYLKFHKMPEDWQEWVQNVDDHWLALIVFGTLTLILVTKSYLILVVYKCYKYIKTEAGTNQHGDPEVNVVSDLKFTDHPVYKPPKYEDIQKVPLCDDVESVDTKPPPYVI